MSETPQAFVAWLRDHAWPFWKTRGWDQDLGGWFESLDSQGEPNRQVNRRTRVQARQVVALCQAADLGWDPQQNIDLARKTCQWWWQHGWAVDGKPGFCHQLDANAQPLDPKRDAYDTAFAVLAIAWIYRVTGDDDYLSKLNQVVEALTQLLGHPQGGFYEFGVWQDERFVCHTDTRRQNPHMHMFEAMVAARQALLAHGQNSDLVDSIGLECHQLFTAHFLNQANAEVVEHFDANWQPLKDPIGRRVEPGHGMEWVWLLHHANQSAPGLYPALPTDQMQGLFDTALRQGFDRPTGVLADWFDPAQGTSSDTARSWPTMEYVRAAIALGQPEHIERSCAALMEHFNLLSNDASGTPNPLYGGWRDAMELADPNAASARDSSMQTSIMYHVMGVAHALMTGQ